MRLPLLPIIFYTVLISVIVFVLYEFQKVDDEVEFPQIFSIDNVLPAGDIDNVLPAGEFDFNKLFELFPPARFQIREGIERHNEKYCVWYNYESSDYLRAHVSQEIPVVLTTFSTVNYLDRFYRQVQSWDGLISYTAFFDAQSGQTPGLLAWLHNCMPDVKKKVSVHLVWPQKENISSWGTTVRLR
uniref:Glycosyltransferase family 92 protein n=1 Tax=Steinernema glaseri TaxID=37863 RepID=A0A1I7ZMI7_9BILA